MSKVISWSDLSVKLTVILPPAGVFFISAEEAFLTVVINYTNIATVHFKLSPAYILYAVARSALQRHCKQSSPITGQTHSVTQITNKMVAMTRKVIQASPTIITFAYAELLILYR